MNSSALSKLETFAERHDLTGLSSPSVQAIVDGEVGYTVDKGRRFLGFQRRIDKELLTHRVIHNNRYTAWFKHGNQSEEQVKAFIVQFSVFSNLFLVAQLRKMINADSLDGMRASKEILANEIGVVFRSSKQRKLDVVDKDKEGDPELVSTDGTVEGGTFRFRAAHFEWLLYMASKLGLGFNDLGKSRHGIESTLFFCDELARLYGNEDYAVSQSASYAVENWANAGFWDELVDGFTTYNHRQNVDLPLAFFTWHSRLEAQHARHTQEELEEYYFPHDVDEDRFIAVGNEMLDGVAAFWDGLEEQRKSIC